MSRLTQKVHLCSAHSQLSVVRLGASQSNCVLNGGQNANLMMMFHDSMTALACITISYSEFAIL